MRRKTGILPELRESERHKPPHLTCGQTSGTSSQRFWLLCSPAESYRLHTTTSCPAARLSLWQPPQTQQALDGITLTPTEPPKSQVCFHRSASVEPKKKSDFCSSLHATVHVPSFLSVHLFVCMWLPLRGSLWQQGAAWLVLIEAPGSNSRKGQTSSADPSSCFNWSEQHRRDGHSEVWLWWTYVGK